MSQDAKLQYFKQAAQEQVTGRKSVYPPTGDHTMMILSTGSKMRAQAFAPPIFYAKMLCLQSNDASCVGKVYDFVNSGNSDPKIQKIRSQDLKRVVMALPQITPDNPPYYWTNDAACEYYDDFGAFSLSVFDDNIVAGVTVRCVAKLKDTKSGHTITVQDYSALPEENTATAIAARVQQYAAQIRANPPDSNTEIKPKVSAVAVPPTTSTATAQPSVAQPPPGRRPPPGRQ